MAWADQSGKPAVVVRRPADFRRDPAARSRGHSKFGAITHHVGRAVCRDLHERVASRALRPLDQKAAHRVADRHALDDFFGRLPPTMCRAIGCERHDVEHRQQSQAVQFRAGAPPFVSRIWLKKARRRRAILKYRRLRLIAGDPAFAWIPSQ